MKLISLLIITILASGCAAKKMAAQNADLLIENQIGKRLPLYTAQKAQLSKDVKSFLNEQKEFVKEVLPIISHIELDASKVDQQYDHLDSLYQKLAQNFSKLMSKYMAPLDSKQQKDFADVLKLENKKLKELSGNEQMEKIYDRFENLFGDITEAQKKIFKDQKPYLEERHTLRMERREKLHLQFLEIYKTDTSNESRQRFFAEAFTNYQKSYPDSPKNKAILKQIMPTLSKKQKDVFKEKTQDLQEIVGYYIETDY